MPDDLAGWGLDPPRLKSATLLFDQLTFVEADLAGILSDDAREGKVSVASRNKLTADGSADRYDPSKLGRTR